jgi:hypothetical protein
MVGEDTDQGEKAEDKYKKPIFIRLLKPLLISALQLIVIPSASLLPSLM